MYALTVVYAPEWKLRVYSVVDLRANVYGGEIKHQECGGRKFPKTMIDAGQHFLILRQGW